MKVRYNRGAVADLDEILDFISERNPAAAAAQLLKFEAAARLISRNPEIVKPTMRHNLRRIVLGNYLLVYEIGATEITIQYIRHGARRRPWEDE